MRLEKIVWYDRHHVLLSFDKSLTLYQDSHALSRSPRSIKIVFVNVRSVEKL